MCNCGNKRSQYKKANLTNPSPVLPSTVTPASTDPRKSSTKFMYTGRSSLKIIGTNTGQSYHFRYRGEILEINAGDSSFMMTIPELAMVKSNSN